MNNFAVELLFFTNIFGWFWAILTTKIYSKSGKEIQPKKLFCTESIANP